MAGEQARLLPTGQQNRAASPGILIQLSGGNKRPKRPGIKDRKADWKSLVKSPRSGEDPAAST